MLLSGKGTRPVGQLRPPPLTAYNQVPSCYDGLPDGPDLSRACERVLSTLVLEWQCSAIPYLSVLERIEDVITSVSERMEDWVVLLHIDVFWNYSILASIAPDSDNGLPSPLTV